MKTWFVYLINGKNVATWANNSEEAEENLVKEYGNVEMKYVTTIFFRNPKIKIDEVTYIGMSAVDKMIACGLSDLFSGLR